MLLPPAISEAPSDLAAPSLHCPCGPTRCALLCFVQASTAAILSMYNSPSVGAGHKTSAGGSPPALGVMKTPELNQVSQMMSSMNMGSAQAPAMYGVGSMQVRKVP